MRLFAVEHRPWSQQLRVLALMTGAALVVVMLVDEYLATPDAPQIVTSYEIAENPDKAERIHEVWQRRPNIWPQLSLWLDFVFIGLYAVFLIKLANHFLFDRPGVREQKAGRLAKLLLVGGALGDATENACLIMAIHQPESSIWPPAAAVATMVKFTGLLVGGACLLVVRAARRHPMQPEDWHH